MWNGRKRRRGTSWSRLTDGGCSNDDSLVVAHADVVEVDSEDYTAGQRGYRRPGELPTGKPGLLRGGCLRRGEFAENRVLGEIDDLATGGAYGEMGKSLLSLVER